MHNIILLDRCMQVLPTWNTQLVLNKWNSEEARFPNLSTRHCFTHNIHKFHNQRNRNWAYSSNTIIMICKHLLQHNFLMLFTGHYLLFIPMLQVYKSIPFINKHKHTIDHVTHLQPCSFCLMLTLELPLCLFLMVYMITIMIVGNVITWQGSFEHKTVHAGWWDLQIRHKSSRYSSDLMEKFKRRGSILLKQ